MTNEKTKHFEVIIRKLLNNEVVIITDETSKKEVKARLREIKTTCTTILKQLKEY